MNIDKKLTDQGREIPLEVPQEPEGETVEVLIVEDSPTQALQLQYILERHGYRVSTAANGAAALALLRRQKPMVILSDIIMPGMDGYRLCKQIKKDERFKNVPVILLTVLSGPEDVIRGLECGADAFITKPYDDQHLLARVQYFLANRHLHKEEKAQMGLEIFFAGQKHFIVADRLQMLNLLLSVYESALQKNQELLRVQDALRQLNDDLEAKVTERTAALMVEIAEHKQAGEEIRGLNAELERRVAERTAGLEATNEELEAFVYSVSHDLRAPLRVIDGFSRIVLEDYAERLDAEGRRQLHVICDGAQKMGQLIDELLNFSRMGRREMLHADVDMTALVTSVVEELRQQEPERALRITIAPLPAASGEPVLLRQVWVNLLANAVKFTRPRPIALIEVGGYCEERENIYFVKDNGAGFNMQYIDQLFGVFRRLHSPEEFEGTGIGMALAQRILHRHGGRIWAEGKVNEGATFSFALPKKAECAAETARSEP